MNTRRSYLDNVNAGRQRRPEPNFDELDRTLSGLEGRVNNRFESPRRQETAAPRSRYETDRAYRHDDTARSAGYGSRDLRSLAREMETSRQQEESLSSIGRIAGELKAMREELRQQMGNGLKREFDALRADLQRAAQTARTGPGSELGAEFDRLSDAVRALSERSDDKSVNMLRLELNQVKSALDSLAREETVRSVDRRWDDFDRKWDTLESKLAGGRPDDGAVGALKAQLADIGRVVNGLPDSHALKSMENRLHKLAGSIDQFAQHGNSMPAAFTHIEQRLDEITRAIAATATPRSHFDPEPFERVEARISALANQIDELVEDQSSGVVIDRLNALSQRVDDIAHRIEIPELVVERLASQIAVISDKIERQPADAPSALLHGIEDRFEQLADVLERRQGDAAEQGRMLFRELERRLEEVATGLDQRALAGVDSAPVMAAIDERFGELMRRIERQPSPEREAIELLESRLEQISRRIEASARQSSGIDPDIVRNLEAQVASLTSHLAQPGQGLPEFEDIGPRLEHIERSLNAHRDSILSAAREAAREAVGSIRQNPADPGVSELATELRALEQLTRRSDERNTKTFEAVHDTLLKIVDRLGVVEHGGTQGERQAAPKLTVPPPAMDDFDDENPVALGVGGQIGGGGAQGQSPSQAAAAAARHALGGDGTTSQQPAASRLSMLGGLTRAFRRDKDAEPLAAPVAAEPRMPRASELAFALDEPLDSGSANEPLEPGSGAPDLNAIMRRVREERAPGNAEAAKSDFIAAARRAAQAAAAEAQHSRRSGDGGQKAGKLGSLSNLFKMNRKTVLMTATALVVVLAGLQIGKAFLGENGSEVAETQTLAPLDTLKAEAIATSETSTSETVAQPAANVQEDSGPVRTVQPGEPQNLAPQIAGQSESSPSTAADRMLQVAALPAQSGFQPVAKNEAPVQAARPAQPADTGPTALREAADEGDPKAMFEVASRYAEGRGVKADLAKAADWYRRAAETGYAPAEYRLGNFYEKGTGVERDALQARTWYERSAKQGNVSAMHNLAVLYAMGPDGKPDNEQAARWFIEAAELGVKDSQYNLGILAAKGVGMPQSLEESYKWFSLVANAGDRDAATKRDEVAKALRPEQLTRAKQTTELWKPREPVAEANAVDIPDEWTGTSSAATPPAGFDMRQAVFNIQTILNKNGYDAGGADGVMGQKTRNAIMAFQSDNGMTADGEVNDALVKALLARK